MDRLKHSLMKAEDDCKVERKHTLKLRHAMEQRPSQELLWELQQERDLLQARVQELEVSVQVGLPAVQQALHLQRPRAGHIRWLNCSGYSIMGLLSQACYPLPPPGG